MSPNMGPPFWWIPRYLRAACLYATTLEEGRWRVEASKPFYSFRVMHDHPMDIFDLCYFEEDFKAMAGDYLKRALEAAAGPEGAVHFRDEELEKAFPALFDYLACAIGPNGKAREGACLIVYARDGEVTACIKDRGLKKTVYGRSDGFWEAMRELEAKLKSQ